jgi:hypothetical protein
MSYKSPLASTADYGIIKVGSGLQITDGELSNSPIALFNQGYFYSTATQTNPVGNAVNLITFNNTGVNVGITLVAGTQITVSRTANYVFQATLQVNKTDAGDDLLDVWIVRNGVNYPNTNSQSNVVGPLSTLAISFSYTLALDAGDNIEIAWQATDIAMQLLTIPAQVGPVRPVTPSARCTLIQI